MSRSRAGDATIRGFNYQFDASIRLIVEAGDNDTITVEGVEDVDIADGLSMKAVQCKYYEGTKLTKSVLRNIVKPMLKDHKDRKSKITYFIYGYFKEKSDLPLNDAKKFKAEVLAYSKILKKKKVLKNIANDLRLSIADIEDFLRRLNFRYTKKYALHKDAVIELLKKAKNCSTEDAKHLYYPNAFTLVSDLAALPTETERAITKAKFLAKIDSQQILFHHWLLREKDKAVYCRTMRRNFFTQTNVSPYARFFSIECSGSESVYDLKDLLHLLGSKWSSSRRVRLEPRYRYAPYVLFRNSSPEKLAALKTELYGEGTRFTDGYPFNSADFTPEHIHSDQTNEHRISVRILADETELEKAMDTMTTRTRELYEFTKSTLLSVTVEFKHVRIPITTISMIPNII